MRVKRVSREKITGDEDKENSKNKPKTILEGGHIEENLNNFSTEEFVSDVTSDEGILDLSVKKTSDDDSLISVIVYENTNVSDDNQTLARKKQSKKRCFEDAFELSENNNPTYSCNYTHDGDTISWKKKCIELEARIKRFENDYMALPKEPAVVQFFVEFGNVLSGVKKNLHTCDAASLSKAANSIGITKDDLDTSKSKTPTALARALMKCKYPCPNPNVGFSQVDASIIQAIIKCVRYRFPCATTSESELRRAMNNYISTYTYKTKSK